VSGFVIIRGGLVDGQIEDTVGIDVCTTYRPLYSASRVGSTRGREGVSESVRGRGEVPMALAKSTTGMGGIGEEVDKGAVDDHGGP